MDNTPALKTRFDALRRVRAHFRTEQEMATAFEVTQPTVWRWLNEAKQLPADQVIRAEHLTGVSRHELREDYYPIEEMRA